MIPAAERVELAMARSASGRGVPGTACREVAGAVCMLCELLPEVTMVNRVLGLGLSGPPAPADLDEIDAFFRERGCRYAVSLAPGAEPADLAERLTGRGFERGYAWMKFVRPSAPPPEGDTSLRVMTVGPERAAEFGRVVGTAYGMPPSTHEWIGSVVGAPGWDCYLAVDGDDPAGAGALFVDGDAGWLGFAGTLPEHRRKGAQGAILAARIRRARELGIETLVTETGEQVGDRPSNSYRNILRFGFEEGYLRPNYIAPLA